MKTRIDLLRSTSLAAGTAVALLGLACGGGGTATGTSATAPVALSLSDASTEDWSVIGVKLVSIALIPQGGTAAGAVTIYTAPAPDYPTLNLAQLDQLSELLGNVPVPVGTYTRAILTLAANPGDVYLTAAAEPSAGFAGTAGATYGQGAGAGQVQIQGASGRAGNRTVATTVTLAQPLVVSATGSNALDLEFDLAHPAFIVGHETAATGSLVWAVNLDGAVVRHHPGRIADRVLRHLYGTVTAVAADNLSMTVSKDYPAWPIASPETAIPTGLSLPVQADATNGTLFFNLDSSPVAPVAVHDFSSLAALLAANTGAGQATYVRLVTRYLSTGALVAARVYTSTRFDTVFNNPEGHVLHVSGAGPSPSFSVATEDGRAARLNVTPATRFYFRTPLSATSGIAPISGADGVAFMNGGYLKRGFKVHATADPATGDALDVDIEIARFDGTISNATGASFDYTHRFATASDSYIGFSLPYVADGLPNGIDPATGAAYTGFKWWNLGYPTLLDPGSSGTVTAIQSFVAAVGGSVSFGGTPAITAVPWGMSYATWNAATPGWSALFSILEPTPLPLGTVSAPWTLAGGTGSFQLTVPAGSQAVTVDLDTAPASAPLVYEVHRTGTAVTVNPVDPATAAGQATLAAGLALNTPVKVFGVPQSGSGSPFLKAYVVFYYTSQTGADVPTF